jgi:biopolymer transport protein ExbB/TolQ
MESEGLVSGRTAVQHKFASITTHFIIALLFGGSLIVVGILFNSTPLAVIAPIIAMALYITKANKDTQLSQSIIGDSYYYMGFVFTLISLGAALFYLSINDNVDINTIVGSFGAALVTTVIGLVARLITTSFSFKATGHRKRLEDSVEKSLATFSEQLETLTSTAISSLNKVHTHTEVTLLKTLENYESVNKEISEKYREAMCSGEETISKSIESLAKRINEIEVSPDMVSKPIKTSFDEILQTLKSHNESYEELSDAMTSTNSKLSSQLENSGSQIQTHVDKVETALTKAIDRQMINYEQSLGSTSKEIVASLDSIKALKVDSENQLSSELEGLGSRISEISSLLSDASTPLQESSKLLGDSNEKMKINISDFSSLSDELSQAIAGSQKNMTGLDSMNGITVDLVKVMTRLNEVFNQTITQGQSAGLSMVGSAKATEEASKQVANDIAHVYGALTTQIQQIRDHSNE